MSQAVWRALVATAFLSFGGCATVDIAAATGASGPAASALTASEQDLRAAVAALDAAAQARALVADEASPMAGAMNVLLRGRRDTDVSSAVSRYLGLAQTGAADVASLSTMDRILSDAQTMTRLVEDVARTATQVANAAAAQPTGLMGDVLAVERAIATARKAHHVLCDVVEQGVDPEIANASPDVTDALVVLDQSISGLSTHADAINARRLDAAGAAVG